MLSPRWKNQGRYFELKGMALPRPVQEVAVTFGRITLDQEHRFYLSVTCSTTIPFFRRLFELDAEYPTHEYPAAFTIIEESRGRNLCTLVLRPVKHISGLDQRDRLAVGDTNRDVRCRGA